MLRTTSTRPLFKSLFTPSSARVTTGIASRIPASNAQLRTLSARRPQPWIASSLRPVMSTNVRYATNKNGPPFDVVDLKEEEKIAKTPIEPTPESVSGGSSVRHVFEGSQAPPKGDEDMLAGIKADAVSNPQPISLHAFALLILTFDRKLSKRLLHWITYQENLYCLVLLVYCHTLERRCLPHILPST